MRIYIVAIACLLFITDESSEEAAMQARPVYVAAVDLSCKVLLAKQLLYFLTICIPAYLYTRCNNF